MRARVLLYALTALMLAASCVIAETKLQPLPNTPTVEGNTAVAEAQGVRMVANGASWHGNPSDLEHAVTPVQIGIENRSGRALRIKYDEFVLVGDSRFQYSALSPFETSNEGLAVGGSGDATGHVSFGVGVGVGAGPWGYGPWPYGAWGPGPFVAGYGGYGWGPWGPGWNAPLYDPWFVDPFYGPYGYYWVPPEPLPTRDMLRRALPEGVLEDGGSVAGFVYFQNVSGREHSVTLRARLVDARTGEQFGTLDIRFGVST